MCLLQYIMSIIVLPNLLIIALPTLYFSHSYIPPLPFCSEDIHLLDTTRWIPPVGYRLPDFFLQDIHLLDIHRQDIPHLDIHLSDILQLVIHLRDIPQLVIHLLDIHSLSILVHQLHTTVSLIFYYQYSHIKFIGDMMFTCGHILNTGGQHGHRKEKHGTS